MGENIDEFDEYLSIHQHFPYQNFPLMIFGHLPARPLFVQGVSYRYITRAHAEFFPAKYVYQYTAKRKNSGLAIATRAFQTDRQSCAMHNIYDCGIEMSQFPVTSYLFHRVLVLQLH